MDPDAIVREITRKRPVPPAQRAPHGVWVVPAQAVQKLVDQGWQVSDAVRQVIDTLKLHPPEVAFKGIRAAVYALRNKVTTV